MSVHLPHTLMVWAGMVENDGMPYRTEASIPELLKCGALPENYCGQLARVRGIAWPEITNFQDYSSHNWSAHTDIVDAAIDILTDSGTSGTLQKVGNGNGETPEYSQQEIHFCANVNACKSTVSIPLLKNYIRRRTCFDLERVAAIVVSAFVTNGSIDHATNVVKHLAGVLSISRMWALWMPRCTDQIVWGTDDCGNDIVWIDSGTYGYSEGVNGVYKLHNVCTKANKWISNSKYNSNGGVDIQSLGDLVKALLRVRRSSPRDRCLYIPAWMFKQAGISQPQHIKQFFATHDPDTAHLKFPVHPPPPDAIVVSRGTFRALQRAVFRLFRFWKPQCRLRSDINLLRDSTLLPLTWLEQHVFPTDNVAYIAYWFFRIQRRLQRRVVSDDGWTRFLGPGEGRQLYQNNVHIVSTFEQALEQLVPPSLLGTQNDPMGPLGSPDYTIRLIDHCCLLMKRYVDVHGSGLKQNLVFKPGKTGGSGRGPVDQYNLLCDILSELKIAATNKGISHLPGPTHKFLAKDIMAYHNSWADDAFANDKIPGWEPWLLERRHLVDRLDHLTL